MSSVTAALPSYLFLTLFVTSVVWVTKHLIESIDSFLIESIDISFLIFQTTDLVWLSVALTKSTHRGRKVLFDRLLSIFKRSQGGSLRQELRQRLGRNTASSALLSFLYIPDCQPRDWHCPWWSGPCHINHQARKWLVDVSKDQSDGGNSSAEIPGDSSL